ncbi:hypothetical protein [Aquimarina sediminis]|uniref:hypothetical protein n=1 Tax=Aquimarina sediminis TaxID=2070536 RepID=UPI000CA0650D|nr:hypothetical protein [Aquimarina sediminis]
MVVKFQIAKVLIVLGFLLNLSNYTIDVFDFCVCEDWASIELEETDNSEQKEKEGQEKEDFKEKNKISQFYDGREVVLADLFIKDYPEFYVNNISVFLEHHTPPPRF